jgi:hypothetical protein
LGHFLVNTDSRKVKHRALTIAARTVQVRGAFAKSSVQIKSTRLNEIVMDTSKVIELGSVSEETKGVNAHVESLINPAFGPYEG